MSLSGPQYFEGARAIHLGPRLGRGGEGEVFALADDPEAAVKLYAPDGAARREAKIAAMVRARLRPTARVAFPRALVRDDRARFAGFTMPRVTGAAPLHELYSPGSRLTRFPAADYRFLVRVALNTARAVAQTHEAGCVIGDVNHSGFLIGEDGLVSLIDADSFQFVDGTERHLCQVGVPEYTAPELVGRLSDTVRTPNHDAFGLAVVLFQLLLMGRHPYAGVAPGVHITVPEAIAAHRFAFSRERATGLAPPPGTARLDDLPPDVAVLFERAFAPAGGTARPSAHEWTRALAAMEDELRPCLSSLRHHFPRTAAGCPWCRIETGSGAVLFPLPPHAGESDEAAAAAHLPPFDAAAARAALAAIEVPQSVRYVPPHPLAAEPVPPRRRSVWPNLGRVAGGVSMIALGTVHAVMIPQNWLMSVPALVAGYSVARSGLRRDRAAQAELQHVDSSLARAILATQRALDIDTPTLLKAEVAAMVEERAGLPQRVGEAARRHREARLTAARRSHMAALGLGAPGGPVAPHLVQRLAAAGVATAADVLDRGVEAFAGIPAQDADAILRWAETALSRHDAAPSGPPPDTPPHDGESAAALVRAAELDGAIKDGLARLERATAALDAALGARHEAVEALMRERVALVAEIEGLGGTAPALPRPPPRTLRAETVRRARAIARAGVP